MVSAPELQAAKLYSWNLIARFEYYVALKEFQFEYDENTTTDAQGRKKYPKFRFYTTEGEDMQKHLGNIMNVLTGKEKSDGSYSDAPNRNSASISASTDTKDASASEDKEKKSKRSRADSSASKGAPSYL
jgi:hypothetical protein